MPPILADRFLYILLLLKGQPSSEILILTLIRWSVLISSQAVGRLVSTVKGNDLEEQSRSCHGRTAEPSERPEVWVLKVFRALLALVPTVHRQRKWAHPYLDLVDFSSLRE